MSVRIQETYASNQLSFFCACAEGYSFPTNLDRDPPLGGLAPKTQAQLMHEALKEGWSDEAFTAALAAQAQKKLS